MTIERLTLLWDKAKEIWLSGGWAMIAIALIALVMFAVALQVQFALWRIRYRSVPEKRWRRWIEHPEERRGTVGRLLDEITVGGTLEETVTRCEEVRSARAAPFERDLKVMKVCVSAAPLVGLLGTVTGMLATFEALSTGSGGDKTMGMIASGISEALITTETGLVVALPGLFIQYQLSRGFDRYKAFLLHLEAVITQHRHKQQNHQAWIRRVAGERISRALRRTIADRRVAS